MRVHNIHERRLSARPEAVGALLDGLATTGDALWPRGDWPAMRLDRPLAVGATGGHGPIRYDVEAYEPGRRVRFRFRAPRGFDGFHELVVEPRDEGAVLRHVIEMRAWGAGALSWSLVFRPLHDAVVEDLLDNAERAVTGAVARPSRWSPYVRALRVAMRRRR